MSRMAIKQGLMVLNHLEELEYSPKMTNHHQECFQKLEAKKTLLLLVVRLRYQVMLLKK